MAIAFVQKSNTHTTVANAVGQITFVSNVASGGLIAVLIATVSTTATVSIADSKGNTYSQAGSYRSLAGVGRLSLWYAPNAAAGSCTITITLSVATTFGMEAYEFSGIKTTSPLEGTNGGTGTSSTPATGTITATATDLVIVSFATNETAGGYIGNMLPSPFNTRSGVSFAGTGVAFRMGDDLSAAGNESCTFNQNASVGWVALGASFLTATPPPAPTFAPVYRIRDAGPPLGFPWSPPFPTPQNLRMIPPPAPPVVSPPVPIPPVPPPGIPPVPPVPPAPDEATLPALLAPDERAPVVTRRFMQQWADEHNSLVSTGQLVLVDGEWILVVSADGMTGPVGTP